MLVASAEAGSAHPRAVRLPADLSIVIPTFNEHDNIARLVNELDRALAGIAWEAIFVDDHSPDGTAQAVRQLAQTDPRVRGIMRLGRRGLAGACIEGMLATSAHYVAVMDADLQHDARLLPRMLAALEAEAADLVIGSRYTEGGSVGTFRADRRLGSALSTLLARRMASVDVADPLSGFFMLRREAFQQLAPRLAPEGFKLLLDILTTGRGSLRVLELPYTFGARTAGTSKLDLRNALDFAGLLASKASRGLIPQRFVSFALVGASGVIVHLATLKAALLAGAAFVYAQIAATLIAMTSNFALNNAITYRDMTLRGTAAIRGLLVFYAICGTGALANVGVAAWLHANESVWWIAGLAGCIVGAVWNYFMSSRMLWRP